MMRIEEEQTKILPDAGWAAKERQKQEEADDEALSHVPPFRVHVAEGDIIRVKGIDAVLCPLDQEAFRRDVSMPVSRRMARISEGAGGRILSAAEPETARDLCLKLARKNPGITAARLPGLMLPFRWLFPVFLTTRTAEDIAARVRNALSAADWSGCRSIAIPFFFGLPDEKETAALTIAGAVRNWALDHPERTLSDVWLIGQTRMETCLLADAAWLDPEPVPEPAWQVVRSAGPAGHIRLETGIGKLLITDTDAVGFLLFWDDETEFGLSRCLKRACLPERHVLPGGSLACSGGILPVGRILAAREALPVGQEAPDDIRERAIRALLDAAERSGCRSVSLRAGHFRGADFTRAVITRWSEEHPMSCLGTVRIVSTRPEDLIPYQPDEDSEEERSEKREMFSWKGPRLFGSAV